jgi:predicted GNAT family acetyltransferase
MEPLNKKERKKAYWKFLAFFMVTILFVTGAVFVNFQIPVQENDVLRAQNERLNRELEFQTDFAAGIKEVKAKLDSINQSGQNVMYLEQVVSTKLAGVQESIPRADSLQQRKLYDYVIQTMLALQETKRKLRDLKESQKLIGEYQQNVERYKDALEQSQRDLDICRQLSSQ